MNLCSEDHDEICFEGKHCPLCREKQDAESVRERLQDRLNETESRMLELQTELDDLKASQ